MTADALKKTTTDAPHKLAAVLDEGHICLYRGDRAALAEAAARVQQTAATIAGPVDGDASLSPADQSATSRARRRIVCNRAIALAHCGCTTRPKLAKDDVGIYQSTGLNVFVRVSQGAMQRSAIFLGQPITGIEGQELDLGSFGQIGRLVNDKPPSLHASLQRHVTTVASAPPRNKVL